MNFGHLCDTTALGDVELEEVVNEHYGTMVHGPVHISIMNQLIAGATLYP